MDKRIGAQYYTIRDFCQTLDDFEKSCEKVSKIGYKTVQLSAIVPEYPIFMGRTTIPMKDMVFPCHWSLIAF